MGRRKKITEETGVETPIEKITEEKTVEEPKPVKKPAAKKENKEKYSQEFKATVAPENTDKALAGVYTVNTASLRMRREAGQKGGIMTEIPKGEKVISYGGYTEVNGVKWLYVAYTISDVLFEGYCCGTYLKK